MFYVGSAPSKAISQRQTEKQERVKDLEMVESVKQVAVSSLGEEALGPGKTISGTALSP